MDDSIEVMLAEGELLKKYDALARRSFGHSVADIQLTQAFADVRVALRGGEVVAGGLGLLVPQSFGGKAVLSACLGAGCVAPEERGARLADRLMSERIRALRDQGAVISTMWTSSNGYVRHLGWEAPTMVFAWEASTDDLKRSFGHCHADVRHGWTEQGIELQRSLANGWNGVVVRPSWWNDWKVEKSSLTQYEFVTGSSASGLLSISSKRHESHGSEITVHDFWASDSETAHAMFGFLGRHNTRAPTISFRRSVLPPDPVLLSSLHRFRLSSKSWHPWMLRILDLASAIEARGWAVECSLDCRIEVVDAADGTSCTYDLSVHEGKAELNRTSAEPDLTLSVNQMAVWYAGGYRSERSAQMGGVRSKSRTTLRSFVRATADLEPWMPDLL